MELLELTRPTPAENLALDEALLDQAEALAAERSLDPHAANESGEVLRLWEPESPFVVIGSSSRVAVEVNQTACAAEGVPILRRVSGGTAIVTGPGCLMYALVLNYELRPELRDIDQAHRWVLGRICSALAERLPGVSCQGISDLVYKGRKFSGNSLRCKRTHLLYHGTLLYDYPLPLISRYLGNAVRTPAYRQDRSHAEFVSNLPLPRQDIVTALIAAFDAHRSREDWPAERTAALCFARYLDPAWHFRM